MQLIDPAATRRQAIIEDVYMQVARVHHLWRIHSILFGNTQAVMTVRDAAMFTFGTFQELLQNETILGIQRVLDPQSGKHGGQTASIETALSVLPVAARHNLKTVLKKLRKDCESLKDVRNRELAHRDLKTALLEHPTPLSRVTIRTIRTALKTLSEMLKTISDECGAAIMNDHDDLYPDTPGDDRDPQGLLLILKRSK